ncbi:MAG: hypothetical protein HY561_08190 [Gemmatimonadetes bacterium]|nr:hypothetical protein [Gemmatimonadota bacterium]
MIRRRRTPRDRSRHDSGAHAAALRAAAAPRSLTPHDANGQHLGPYEVQYDVTRGYPNGRQVIRP